jgi:osmotically-inducible protein OsmY
MKPDNVIKQDVDAELRWNPELDETDIATKVQNGIVTLSGFARDYYEKHQAEATVKRVTGVTAVANDLQVQRAGHKSTDPEIARAAVAALKAGLPLSWEAIKPVVHEGQISLEGTAEWQFQRDRAESVVRRIPGVVNVRNCIELVPRVAPSNIKRLIEDAFRRNAQIDAEQITVEARGGEVTLRGDVRSCAEREQAQQSAWCAPGVTHVINELRVRG